MNQTPSPVTLTIFGKEYKIACTPDEHDDLISSAQQLDQQMLEIRDSGKVMGIDRIAVMAALNIAHELNSAKKHNHYSDHGIGEHLSMLRKKIEAALNKS